MQKIKDVKFRSVTYQINFTFFMFKIKKERTDDNVEIIYVWYIFGRNRAIDGYGT